MAIDDETLRLATSARLIVGREVDAATRDLVRSWARAWGELKDAWTDAIDDLIAMSDDGQWPSPWMVARAERARDALDASTQAIFDLSRQAGVRITDGTGRIVEVTVDREQTVLLAQAPADQRATLAVRFDRLDTAALERIVARTAGRVESLLNPLSLEASDAMRRALVRGIALGDNPRTTARVMVRRVEGAFNGGLARAVTIARTEMLDANREATRQTRIQNADLVRGWVWVSTLDTRSCPSCVAMHGTEHDVAEPGPDDHPQGRCSSIPLLKTWAELGFDLDEPASVLPDARAWFDGLSDAEQAALMGPERLALLQSGQVGWDDLATVRSNPGWRDDVVPTPVRDLRALAGSLV